MKPHVLALFVSVAIAGCPTPSPTDAGADAPSPSADVPGSDTPADAGSDAPALPDVGLDAPGEDAPVSSPRGGLVSLIQGTLGSGGPRHIVSATFFAARTIEEVRNGLFDPSCTIVAEVGSCRRVTCSGAFAFEPAGTLTVTTAMGPLTVAEPASGLPYALMGAGNRFAPGETVTFAATGNAVPAFTAEVVAPESVDVTLPAVLDGTSPTITWTGVGGDTMQIVLSAGAATAYCVVPAADGTVTIDQSLLTGLTGPATVIASYFATTTVVVGDHTIDANVALGESAMVPVE